MSTESKSETYVTSFCNFPHRLHNGRPVGHECYIIPPRLLKAERDLPYEEVRKVWQDWYANKGPTVHGRKER